MKKVLLIVIPLTVLSLLIVGVVVWSIFQYIVIPKNKFETFLNDLTSDESSQSLIRVNYGTVHDGDKKFDLDDVSVHGEIKEVFVKTDSRYYFIYIYRDDQKQEHWCIGSAAEYTQPIETHYDGIFGSNYATNFYDPVAEKQGFYYDGVIYLTDFEKVVIYGINDRTVEEKSFSDFKYPEMLVAKITDSETIQLYSEQSGEPQTVTFSQLAQTNEEINKIHQMKSFVIHDGKTSSTEYFFSAVQVFEDKVYILCRVLNYSGDTYAMILEYDHSTGACKYIDYEFTGDVIEGRFYIVEQS